MRFHILGGVAVCLALAQPARGGLSFDVVWQTKGNLGFSGPNEIREMDTGRTLGIVICEVGSGIVCFSPDGRRIWEYKMTPPVTASPAVADVDGDGVEDVVAGDSQGKLVLLDADGRMKWTSRVPGRIQADSCPAIADLDEDGRFEILVGDASGYTSCFDNRGKLLWRFRGDEGRMGPALVADIYDTPGKEIIVPSGDGHIYALTARGEWLWDIYREDDLFPNTIPVLADVDGNGIPELYIGGGLHHFYRIDLEQPRIVLEENVFLHINSAICATDLDGDGKDEVIFGNKGGAVWCYGEGGFIWKREFSNNSMSTSPIVTDLDGDPELEVLFLCITLQALDTDGSVLLDTNLHGVIGSPSLAGDFDDDGMMDLIIAGPKSYGSGNILAYTKWNVPYRDDPRGWTVFAGNRAHTCRVPAAKDYKPLTLPAGEKRPSDATFRPYGDINLLSGRNIWRFDVDNPEGGRLVLLTDVVYPDGSVHHFANHVHTDRQRIAFPLEVKDPGAYRVKQKLLDADRLATISSRGMELPFGGLASDRVYLNDLLKQAAEAIKGWQKSNPAVAAHMRGELLSLKRQLVALERVGDSVDSESMPSLIESARRLRSLAMAGRELAPKGSFFAWEFCPWAYFDPLKTLPTAQDRTEELSASLCIGEYESIALNLTNLTSRTLEVRVLAGDLVGEKTFPAEGHLQFRRAVTVSTIRREYVAYALPLLDQGKLLTIPAMETAQLWITINAIGIEPGDYVANLRLRSIEVDPTEIDIPIHIEVYDLALPRPSPLRFCVWARAASAPEYELKDLIDHGVNVHFGSCPIATCNEKGEIVGEIDFAQHDATVRKLSPCGLMLFLSPQSGLRGQPFLSEPWRRAFVSYIRSWASHMKELGIGYEDWALYPYDEPSTPYARTTLNLVEVARLVKEADPNILIYANPTSGTTMETVEMLTGLVDIWCPSAELLERLGDELIPEAKRVGREVWFYDAAGHARTLSCLGLYRWRFWYAWNLGLTGVGWWVYYYGGGHLWDGPNPYGDYFSTVYKAPGAIVTSKRWEAAREGVEDYEILYLLRDAIRRAKRRGIRDSALADAEKLLEELPRAVESALDDTGKRLPLTPDSVPLYVHATDVVQDARRQIMEACMDLKKLVK